MKALLAMPHGLQHTMFSPEQLEQLSRMVEVDVEQTVPDLAAAPDAVLSEVEVLITGWGSPCVDGAVLERSPRLRAVVHTAGTLRHVASQALWRREDLLVTTAAQANAVPVAEFTLAQILLAGKRSLAREAAHRRSRGREKTLDLSAGGNYGAVVGLIGASRIGTMVAELLQPFSLEVLISDPFVEADAIRQLGATKVELPELFRRSDVVSLHAPDVPSTQKMVTAELLSSMPDGATFVNTARPALVDLDALRAELVSGRLGAALDVHDDLAPDDPLWDVPTVSITPHIAGSLGNELHRMAASALEELRRLHAGEAALAPVDREHLSTTA
ncbi:hydroxyacid dehydrogenase [Brachybacterium vulturis]|uniref:hydroxyacid dehydrogenase n=1 Tax=Brachybacterium vulturis TaxID=2017484 RepID=UPI003735DAC6